MSRYTSREKENKGQYFKEFFPPIVIYILMILAIKMSLAEMEGSIWIYPVALSPLLPIYYIFRAVVRFIRRSDEFMRKLYRDSAVITLIIVNFLGFAYGLLINVGVPAPDLFVASSLVCPLYFITVAYLKRKYGGDGC